jgi:hypothetical protein
MSFLLERFVCEKPPSAKAGMRGKRPERMMTRRAGQPPEFMIEI